MCRENDRERTATEGLAVRRTYIRPNFAARLHGVTVFDGRTHLHLGIGTAGQDEQREQQIKTTMLHSLRRG